MLQYHQGSLAHCCDLNFYFDSLSIKRFRSSDIITLFNRHQSVKEHHASTRRHQCPGSLPPRRVLTVVDHTLTSDRNSVTCHPNIAKPSPTKVYRDLSTVVDHTLTSDRNSVTCHFNIAKPSPTKVYRDVSTVVGHTLMSDHNCHLSLQHRQAITHQGLQRCEYSRRPHSDV